MADENRILQTKGFDHVPVVEREVEHIADGVTLLAVAVAGKERRIEVILSRELGEEGIDRRRAARTMQEDERLACAVFDVAHGRLVGLHGLEFEGHRFFHFGFGIEGPRPSTNSGRGPWSNPHPEPVEEWKPSSMRCVTVRRRRFRAPWPRSAGCRA